VHHRTIQIDHQPDATIFQFIILMFIYSSTCFGRSPAHQELNDCSSSLWFYLRIMVIAVPCLWSARPRTQHGYHHDTKVKPEAATAVVELLMMGGRTPETRWAVNKRQYNKLKNCCIWLVIYLKCGISSFCKFLNRSDCRPGFSNCRCDAVLIFRVKCIFPVPFSLTFSYERRTSESELQTVTWEALTWHTIPSDVPSNIAGQ